MKKVLVESVLLCFCIISVAFESKAQITVPSSDGYLVDINVQAINVTPSTNSCTWGYNYTVTLSYYISFNGTNIPAALYDIQGTLTCNSGGNYFDLPEGGGSGTTITSNAWTSTSDCNGITPAKLGCNTINIKIQGPGIDPAFSNGSGISYPINYSPLPIILSDFRASAEKGKIKLNWATASEINNKYFVIQRSVNGNEWIDLDKINASGNSNVEQQYNYYDLHPAEGVTYYRLKQVDIDGHFSFSKIITVNFHSENASIAVSPIPNRTNSIKIYGITNYSDYDLKLIEINGRVVYSTSAISSSMNFPQILPGIYLLRFTNRTTNESSTIRYLKL